MRFGEIAELRRQLVRPDKFKEYCKYLGYDSIAPGSLHITQWDTPKAVSSAKLAFFPNDTIYGRLRPYFRKVVWTGSSYGICSSDFWVFQPKNGTDPRFLFYVAALPEFTNLASASATGTRMPRANWDTISEYEIADFTYEQQMAIGDLLGRLDDKIDFNHRRRVLCRKLGLAITDYLIRNTSCVPLSYYAESISRGVTPKYYKGHNATPICVLNQRCIRDGWVSLSSARLMLPRRREKKSAIAEFDDLLVNSTGQGTLGRVGRWSYREPVYVDGHVTVVKADRQRISPVLLPYLVFPLQSEIEQMAEGSTGQTELSPSSLGSLQVPLLTLEEQKTVVEQLSTNEEMAHHCSIETRMLAELRDTLLPELMSGRMRVDEAGRLVADAFGKESVDD